MTTWDYLIVTASNERQAEAYRSQLELRRQLGRIPQAKTVLAIADPGGIRVGSGGSTIFCLMRVLERELAEERGWVKGRAFGSPLARGLKPRASTAAFSTPGKPGASAAVKAGEGGAADPRAWREILDRLRILIIHAGGDSKRLPAYGPCGKIFVPVPADKGAEQNPGRGLPATIFDRLAPIYLSLPAPASGRGHTVISTGDVLLFFEPRRAAFVRSGITALGCLAPPEISRNHGVFIPDHEGKILRYLQKPTVAAQKESGAIAAGAGGRSILDMGVMSFDAAAAVRLLKMCGVRADGRRGRGGRLTWSGPTAAAVETKGLDVFREIACALGADTKFSDYTGAARAAGSVWTDASLRRIYGALAGTDFSLSLLPRCRFLHFGTSRELIRSGNALRRRDRTAAPGDSVVSLNNAFVKARAFGSPLARGFYPRASPAEVDSRAKPGAPAALGQGCIAGRASWVEGCRIGARLEVPGGNVVVGLDIAAPLDLPRRAAIDVLKGKDRRGRTVWFVRAYGVDDVFHGGQTPGQSPGVCFRREGSSLDNPEERDVCDDQAAIGRRVVRDNRVDQVGRLAGLPLGEWLEAVGATPGEVWPPDVAPADRQVWNGRFFPAVNRATEYRKLLWMLEPRKATAAQKRLWRRADRYSFAEMAVLADQDAFHARRRV